MSFDPSSRLISAENALRDLIRHVLSGEHGADWIDHLGVTDDRLTRWKGRQIEETKRREGRTSSNHDLLDYSDLPDLTSIIRKNWPLFKDSLGSKKTFDVYMDRLEAFRVAVVHSRDLLPFERQILSGVSGEIRNRVTIVLAGSDPDREYFPRLERARDSFGNESTEDHDTIQTGLTLCGLEMWFALKPRDGIPKTPNWSGISSPRGRVRQ